MQYPTDVVIEESIWQAINLVDWGQSAYIAEHPTQFHESRSAWLLGNNPTPAHVAQFMIGGAIFHAFVTGELQQHNMQKATRIWEAATITLDGSAVLHNYHVNIKVHF